METVMTPGQSPSPTAGWGQLLFARAGSCHLERRDRGTASDPCGKFDPGCRPGSGCRASPPIAEFAQHLASSSPVALRPDLRTAIGRDRSGCLHHRGAG